MWFLPGLRDGDLDCAAALIVYLYNAQARGEGTLQSADSEVPLFVVGPEVFLSEGLDRRVAVEATREVVGFTRFPAWARDTAGVVAAPEVGATDEELLHGVLNADGVVELADDGDGQDGGGGAGG